MGFFDFIGKAVVIIALLIFILTYFGFFESEGDSSYVTEENNQDYSVSSEIKRAEPYIEKMEFSINFRSPSSPSPSPS